MKKSAVRNPVVSSIIAAALLAAPALAQRVAPPPAPTVDPAVAALRDAALGDTVAYDIVEGITTEVGPRLAGTDAEARARRWSVAKLTGLGFKNVRIEPYRMPVWVRGEESAEVVAPYPQKLRLTALGNSGATPPAGITLPVAFFDSYAALAATPDGSLKGKIAFVSNAMVATQDGSSYGQFGAARFVGPNLAAKKGASAIVIRSIGSDHGRGPHAGNTNFEAGVKPIPSAALSVADADNLERMVKRGGPVTLHLTLTPRQTGMHESGNVIAEVPGTDPSAGVILIGGHLDSWDLGTGAIDDGAGIAITAAAAHALLAGPPPRRTIRIVWFGAEEVGGVGGRAYFDAHKGDRHVLAMESDFGADRVWRAAFNLGDGAGDTAARVAAALAPLGIVRSDKPARGGTDIGPVVGSGVAVIDLEQDGTRYFDWHHTPEDTLERIDPVQLRQNVAAWAATLAIVANAIDPLGPVPMKR